MEKSQIERFSKDNEDDFKEKHLEEIKVLLEQADESVIDEIEDKTRDAHLWGWLHWIAGEFGIDRFVLGKPVSGVLKLLWFVVFGILGYTVSPILWGVEFLWWLIDEFTITSRVRKYNYNKAMKILGKEI